MFRLPSLLYVLLGEAERADRPIENSFLCGRRIPQRWKEGINQGFLQYPEERQHHPQ
jgi:hypothetical protein